MSMTTRQKTILVALLGIVVFLFTTYYDYPWHPDHYSLGQYTYATIENGYVPWVLHPASLFGYYPLSVASGFEFFFATFHNLTGLDLPILFYFFSIFSALFGIASVFLLMRQFNSFETSFLTAVIFATSVLFVKNMSNTASSRMFNIVLYPLFIFALFKIWELYDKERKISFKYILVSILLFVFMNLIHRLGQLLIIFLIAFTLAFVFANRTRLIHWMKSKKVYHLRKKLYDDYPLLPYIDLGVLGMICFTFFFLKVKLLWVGLVVVLSCYYLWQNFFQLKRRKRTSEALFYDMMFYGFLFIISKVLDLLFRGRLIANIIRVWEKYSFQLSILMGIGFLLGIVAFVMFFKYRKRVGQLISVSQKKVFEFFTTKPERAVLIGLFTIMLLFISRNFTGDNFYRFGLSHYTSSFLLKGESPWVIMINFMLNLNNNITILIHFAAIGIVYLFLKKRRLFYDYFFIFVAIGFSQFLLDWEYIRLYIVPLYIILIAFGIIALVAFLSKILNKKIVASILIGLLILHFVIGNVFIQRERLLGGIDEVSYSSVESPFFVALGGYLQDKGDFSIHTGASKTLESRVAYYSTKVDAVLAQSTFIDRENLHVDEISLQEVWKDFRKGKKIRQIYSLEDTIFGGDYYFGRHIGYLNNRPLTDPKVQEIVKRYNIKYIINDANQEGSHKFFLSFQDMKNKVYSSEKLELYDLTQGR